MGAEENDQRLDRFLQKYLNKAPGSLIQKLIRTKKIKYNGKKAKPEDRIFTGGVIQIYVYDEVLEGWMEKRPRTMYRGPKLEIVCEDEHLLLINKPTGIMTHGAEKSDYGKTVVDGLLSHLMESGAYIPRRDSSFRPAVANRLDRNTSGLIIGCKTYEALKDVNQAIRRRKIRKFYRTVVVGNVENTFAVDSFLTKDAARNIVKSDLSGKGKESRTVATPLRRLEGYTELEIELVTGRTHQIRVHLAERGHPIVGDPKYGDLEVNRTFAARFGLHTQLLHAHRLEFGGLEILTEWNDRTISCTPEENYMEILKYLRGDS